MTTDANTLPNLLIIGAKKAASTSLYRYFGEHPDVFMSPLKETNFLAFDAEDPQHAGSRGFPVTTLETYRDLFSGRQAERIVGEASPRYLHSDVAIRRIAELVPRAKLVVSLRNPVDRAYSGYLMALRHGRQKLDIRTAGDPDAYWIQNSLYARQIEKYLSAFGAEQLKVVLFDDLKRDALAVMRELFGWVGVDDGFRPDVGHRHNPGGVPRSRFYFRAYRALQKSVVADLMPAAVRNWARRLKYANLKTPQPLPAEVRSAWLELFRADILRLQELIGRDLSGWLAQSD